MRCPSDRPKVFVHLLPSLIPPGSLRGGVAVVVDVLRATTVMVHALAAGCEAVIPCGEIDEAQAVAAGLPPGTALLAGERGGLPIPGFDLGNSPGDFTPEVCEGKTLVMTTTNGTRGDPRQPGGRAGLHRRLRQPEGDVRRAVVQFLKKDHGHPIHIVCSGTEGFISLEDSLLAGALAKNSRRDGRPMPARANALWQRRSVDRAVSVARGGTSTWNNAPSGQLLERGPRRPECDPNRAWRTDIEAAAEFDRFDRSSPSCAAIPCGSWRSERQDAAAAVAAGLNRGAGPAKVMPLGKVTTMLEDMDKLVSLCKRRGFIFPSSEIYGGINGFWDYGPLGVELKRNIKDAWWRDNVRMRDDMVGLDCSIIMNPEGLGGVGACRRVHRPDGRLPGDQGALPGRPDLRASLTSSRRSTTRESRPRPGWPVWAGRPRRPPRPSRRRPPSWPSGSAQPADPPSIIPYLQLIVEDREKVDRPVRPTSGAR